MRLKKPEAPEIQGTCVVCNDRKQTLRIKGKYRPTCIRCHRQKHINMDNHNNTIREIHRKERKPYRDFLKDSCEKCGFIPEHTCQLDVDHIDGNHYNNAEENLQTLCANCHRLKTHLNRDWDKSR